MIKQARNIPVLVAAAFAAAACSGGHSTGGSPGANGALTIGRIADITVDQDTKVGPVSVPVTEGQMPASAFTVTAASSDTTLLPPGAILVQAGAGAPTLSLTPADGAVGSAMVTVTATDSKGQSAKQSFNLTFKAVYASFATLALGTFADSDTAAPVPVIGKTYLDDANDPSTFASLLQ